ncbi:hypothetical protein PGT21_005501 [Puccinia graminis f. sp. tritici]|uniref:Uncharacterized protein n=1 Tax=Puccinia graminis f. sp. tritici TaxID=56615 RepID=A0A5B0QI62_PUCGR|nr:hypothetical protein PGT21_005501 [Puccinia graminis f. sp. tritici]
MVETPDPNPGDGLDRGLCRAWTPPCRHDITADAFLASRFLIESICSLAQNARVPADQVATCADSRAEERKHHTDPINKLEESPKSYPSQLVSVALNQYSKKLNNQKL